MLRFFGGVPELLVPDNRRPRSPGAAAMHRRSTPPISWRPTMARRAAGPALAQQGQGCGAGGGALDPGPAAASRFFSLAANAAIAELLPALNERPFQGRTESRKDLFEAPACAQAAAPGRLRVRRVAQGEARHRLQSRWTSSTAFPMPWWGRSELRITATTVEVMHKGKRVAGRPPAWPGTVLHPHRAHAQVPPGPPGLVTGALPELGRRALYRPGGQAAAGGPSARRTATAPAGLLNLGYGQAASGPWRCSASYGGGPAAGGRRSCRKNCPWATSAAPATEGGEHAEPTDYRPTARPQAHRHA